MTAVYFKSIALLADEPLEVYWLAGLRRTDDGRWFVLVALRGVNSGQFFSKHLPIGALPMLSLGREFQNGQLAFEPCRGRTETATVPDVAKAQLITSGEIDPALYSFGKRAAGVQRLFSYDTARGRVLVPAIELARFLFLHNRTLANCIMRPSSLNLLFVPQVPGQQAYRHLRFTKEMPQQCLSRNFIREFTWLALDPEGRRAWDSVATRSSGKDYIEFDPPSIRNSHWNFRGVEHQGTWLALELISLGGRELPSTIIEYSHPKLRRAIRMDGELDHAYSVQPTDSGSHTGRSGKSEQTLVVEDDSDGASSTIRSAITRLNAARPHFENASIVQPIPEEGRYIRAATKATVRAPGGSGTAANTSIRVSAGERVNCVRGNVRPLEFQMLAQAPLMELGTLEILQQTAKCMAQAAPHLSINSAPCFLKEGRSFSMVGRNRRTALIVVIRQPQRGPIALLDVERTGVPALALLALKFNANDVSDQMVEAVAKRVLDGLVDRGGFWDTAVEAEIVERCACERLPKALFPRTSAHSCAAIWAARLLVRLDLGPTINEPA